jgi:predicted permease
MMNRGAMPFRNVFSGLTGDVRSAVRQLTKARGFAGIAILTLALGIGANTAIFTVVHHLLLAPLPYPDGNGIVRLQRMAGGGRVPFPPDAAVYRAWEARSRTLESFAAEREATLHVAENGAVDSVPGAFVTPGFMKMLHVSPARGREFVPDDARAAAAPVAVIGNGLWRRAYGGRDDVLGALIHVNGRAYTIVGVAPPDLVLPMSGDPPRDVLLPLNPDTASYFEGYARLRAGVTPEVASAEMRAIIQSESLPDSAEDRRLPGRAMRAQDFLSDRMVLGVKVLFAAVGLLLLIACANVANLLLARGWTRRREFALRIALGASRGRLARQMLIEAVLLAAIGGALGIAIAVVGLHIIIATRPPTLDDLAQVHIQRAVLLWTVALSVLSGVAFGSAPALLAGARPPGEVLRSGARGSSGGPGARRVRASIVVVQVALSLVLLVGAGLLVRSFVSLLRMPLGFDSAGLTYVAVGPRPSVNEATAAAQEREMLRQLQGAPGIAGAQLGVFPNEGLRFAGDFQTEGAGGPVASDVHMAAITNVAPGYFRFLGIPLLTGRVFDAAGLEADRQSVVINRELAQRLWQGRNPVGQRMRFNATQPWLTVIGVVGDVRFPGRVGDSNELAVYDVDSRVDVSGRILLRGTDPVAVDSAIRRAMASVGPSLRLYGTERPRDILEFGLAPQRFNMALIGVFALVALALTAVGLYGVVAYAVTHRTREIGVRVALGAQPGAVSRLVMGEGLKLTAVGVVIGLAAAAVATRALTSILFGINPLDPLTFGAIALVLVATTLVATYVPALRALRIDPNEALRAE